MPNIDDLPFNKALVLYEQMKQAALDNDQITLERLKKSYPSLFQKTTVNLLRITVKRVNKLLGRQMHYAEH